MKKQKAINLLVLIVAIMLLFTTGCFDEESTVNANEITAFEMTDWVFGETAATPKITATHGADTVKYYLATEENGEYTEITDFSSLKPGTYYLKAVIEKTKEYDGAEKIVKFEVKNHTVHTAVGGWQKNETEHWEICACGEKFNVSAHAAGTELKHGAGKNYHWNECECGFEMNKTEHTATGEYLSDGTNHWKLCSCGEKVGEEAHVSDNTIHYNDDKTKEYNTCTTCGAAINEIAHVHAATGEYLKDGANHWKLCACGEKVGEEAHVSDNTIHYNDDKTKEYNTCAACGAVMNETAHTHTAKDDNYEKDGANHWKLCACGTKVGEEAHVSDDLIHYNDDKTKEYNTCTACGAIMNETDHTHTATGEYLSDTANHWKLCVCGAKVGETAHVSDETTHYDVANMKEYNSCTVCGARMNETEHTHDYASEKTENGYECVCGTAVNPFGGLVKTKTVFYDTSKVSVADNSLFGGSKIAASAIGSGATFATSDGSKGLEYTGYFNRYYFAIKLNNTAKFVEGNGATLNANTWYIVKIEKRTTTTHGGWLVFVKEATELDEAYKNANISDWRMGDHASYGGKAVFNCFLLFETNNSESYDVETSELYAEEPAVSSPFEGMDKLNIGYLKNYSSEGTVFGGKSYVYDDLTSGDCIGADDGVAIDSEEGYASYYKNIYFAVKATEEIGFLDGGSNIINPVFNANVWYVVKMERKTRGWNLFIKVFGQSDSAYAQINMDGWKLGDHNSYNGKAYANVIMAFKSVGGNNFGMVLTEMYVKEPDFTGAFDGLTKVSDSVLNGKASLCDKKFSGGDVYLRENIVTADTTNQDFGSTYDISFTGEYTEYRFAIKITDEEFCPVVWNGGANSLKPNMWYVIKLEKRTGENARGWNVFIKRADLDDSAFTQISVDDWTIGNHDAYQGNTKPQYFLNIYTLGSWDKVFSAYATGIWAK